MKKIYLILTVAAISLLSGSCYYDQIPIEPVPDTISYNEDIQPIFNQSCVQCHTTGGINPDLTAGNSYNALLNGGYVIPSNAEGSPLYQSLIGNPQMPPGAPLSQDKIDLVKKWINDGALNN